jgi:TolB protein
MSRLVVIDGADIRIVDPRNGHSVGVPPHGTRRLMNRQPVWSPDGTRIAWSAFDRRQPDSPTFVSIVGVDGRARVDHAVVFPAFYLQWRPDGRAVAALGEGPLGLELTVIDVASGAAEILTRGTPLFFDWSPDGAVCANVGRGREQRLELHDGRNAPDPMQSLTPVPFSAPAWCSRAEVVVAVVSESRRVLAVVDRQAAIQRTIATLDGSVRFAATADAARVAWVETGGGATPLPQPDRLQVHDLDDDTRHHLTDDPVVLFCWSPDRRALLYASMRERGESPLLQWHVWRDGATTPYGSFRPSGLFARDYLPFAEQYVRSMSLWAPDSRAFCYAGTDRDGNDGVWVQPTEGRLQHVTSGQFAAWSPGSPT